MSKNSVQNKIIQWDRELFLKIKNLGGNKLVPIMKIVTFLGREPIWLGIIAFFSLVYIDQKLYLSFGNMLLFGLIIVDPIKRLVNRKRPYDAIENCPPFERTHSSSSFPSWHTYNAMSFCFLFGYLSESWLILLIALFLPLIVGFSRIRLGVHFPTDVMGGAFFALISFPLVIITVDLWIPLTHRAQKYLPWDIINTGWSIYFDEFWYIVFVIFIFSAIFLEAGFVQIRKYFKI